MAHACCVSPFSAQNPPAQYSSGLPGINAQHSALSRLHDQPPGLRAPAGSGRGRSGRAPGFRCGATRSSLGHLTANGCCAGGDSSSPLRAGPGAPHGRLSPGLPWATPRPGSRAILGPGLCRRARRVVPGDPEAGCGRDTGGPARRDCRGGPGPARSGPLRPSGRLEQAWPP